MKNSDTEKFSFILEIFLNGCFSGAITKTYLLIQMVYILYVSKYEVMLKKNEFLRGFFKERFLRKV